MNRLAAAVTGALALVSGSATSAPPAFTITLDKVASYVGSGAGLGGGTGMEIAAYDAGTKRVFAINAGRNSVDVIDLSNPSAPTRVGLPLDFSSFGGGVNSVAVQAGLVAVAAEAAVKTNPGQIVFLDAATLAVVGQVPVGALPDMVTYTSDGAYLLVANEAEPNDSYTIDPEGSVSIVDLRNGLAAATVATAGFDAYIGQEAALRTAGVRIYGNYTVDGTAVGSNAAQDFEPESITVAGPRAYVTLQENNALAVIDIGSAQVLSVKSFGYKNHNLTVDGVAVNGLDVNQSDSGFDLANDNDLAVFGNAFVNGINIAPWPVFGMYQPDGIATLRLPRGEIFLVTANEGDEREWPGLPGGTERTTVSAVDVDLDNDIFPTEALLKTNNQLGRLRITNQLGNKDAGNIDADYEALYVPGARSFSIWTPSGGDSADQLELVWDSADQLESITARRLPLWFNSDHEVNTKDARSRSKGPEPEGVTIGRYGLNQYAFVTLERIGGVMVYDVTNPLQPTFVDYVNPRDFTVSPTTGATDSGPEGVAFISQESSPNGEALLLVGNEVSQTLTVYEITKKKVE